MKMYKKGLAVALAAVSATTAVALTACDGGKAPEQTPFIKEVIILNAPETYYLEGETFDEGDFALQEIYSDGSKKSVTSGYEFVRKQKSVCVDQENWIYEDQDVPLNDPLTSNDDEIYITYKTTCQGYNLTYDLTQSITVKDPEAADTEIFTVGDNDRIYFYGDGHVESYGIQYAPYAHIPGYGDSCRNDGFWNWNGSELVIAMKNYNPNVSEDPTDEYRELIVTKNADGTFSFNFEWAAQGEKVSDDPVTYKTYTYGGTVASNVVKKRLTSAKTYGNQNLKGTYSKQTDNNK